MTYKPIINRPYRMENLITKMNTRPTKKGKKWEKVKPEIIMSDKQFKIYSTRIGQSVKYKLDDSAGSYSWVEITSPRGSSWERAEDDNYYWVRMLIEGTVRTNEFRYKKK